MAFCVGYRYGGHGLAVASAVRLFRELIPFALPRLLPLFGVGLRLIVIMGALVEELGIDLHEQLHSVIYHAMYRSDLLAFPS